MTAKEKERILTVCTVPAPLFDEAARKLWGLADKSGSVFHCSTEPLLINGGKDYAAQLAPLVREILEAEYFAELPNYGAILDSMEALTGKPAAFEIVKFCSWRWDTIRREEAKDRAKAWTAGRDIIAEIDRISPDSLYEQFLDACGKDFNRARDAVLLYGYELGLAAARKGAQP